MFGDLVPYLAPTVVLLLIIGSAIKILPEYERGVVFFLGRFQGVKGPGLIIVIPGIQQMVRVDLRMITLDVPSQDVISKDNVTVRVNAVLYFRVVDPERAIIRVEDYMAATSQLAQTTLRSVLGKHDLDEMLSERDKLNADIQEIIDAQTEEWGIKVANVEIKHVDLNESMIRAIARQAEAEDIDAVAAFAASTHPRSTRPSCRRSTGASLSRLESLSESCNVTGYGFQQ